MASMRSGPLAAGLVVLAVVFAILAVLYAIGTLQLFVSTPGASHHYTHAIVLAVLCVASLVAANFARPQTA